MCSEPQAAALDRVKGYMARPGHDHAKPYCDNFDERAQEDEPRRTSRHSALCGGLWRSEFSCAANQHNGHI